MIQIRSIVFYLGKGLSTVPFFIVALFALLTPPRRRSNLIAGWAHFVTWWLKVTCGLSHDLDGLEHLPDQPCVIACSHSSTWETIVTQTFFPPLAWVLKKELLNIPVFGLGLRATNPIAIDRRDSKNALDQVIEQGLKKFQEGRHVLIFPEGTRTPWGEQGRFKKGAAKLALAGDVPIVPVAHDAGKYWSNKSWWIKPGKIRCIVGPEISVKGKNDTQLINEVKTWIESQDL